MVANLILLEIPFLSFMSKISETFHIFFDQLTGNPKTMRQARFSARRSGPVALLLLRPGQPRREFLVAVREEPQQGRCDGWLHSVTEDPGIVIERGTSREVLRYAKHNEVRDRRHS